MGRIHASIMAAPGGAALLLAFVCLFLHGSADAAPRTPTLSQTDDAPEQVRMIIIKHRAFDPPSVSLRVGHKTRVVVRNTDAELHSFVPVGLLAGLHFHILGNGAPQFDGNGLKRVIIPSQGQAEIRFVPERTGTFPYFCDMPGHEMNATIIVE